MIGRSWRSVVPVALVVVAVLGLGLWPTHRSSVTTDERIEAATLERAALEARVAVLTPLVGDTAAIEAELVVLERRVPAAHDTAGLLIELDAIADSVGIALLGVVPDAGEGTGAAPDGWTAVGFDLRLRGGYLEVIDFVEALAVAERLVVVDAIAIEAATTGALDATVGLRVFHTADPATGASAAGLESEPPAGEDG